MLCSGYTQTLDLPAGELVKFEDARGTTLRVTRGTLWITQEKMLDDVVLNAGDVFTLERDGLTLVESQMPSTVCIVGGTASPVEVHPIAPEATPRWMRALAGRFALAR